MSLTRTDKTYIIFIWTGTQSICILWFRFLSELEGKRRIEENKKPLITRLLKIKNKTIGIVPGVSETNGPKIKVLHSVSIKVK